MSGKAAFRVTLHSETQGARVGGTVSLSEALLASEQEAPILERATFRVLNAIRRSDARRFQGMLEAMPYVASAKFDRDCAVLTVDVLGGISASRSIQDTLGQEGLQVVGATQLDDLLGNDRGLGVWPGIILASLGLMAGAVYTYGSFLTLQLRDVALDVQAILAGGMVAWGCLEPIRHTLSQLLRGKLRPETLPLLLGVYIVIHSWWVFFAGGVPEFNAGMLCLAGACVLKEREKASSKAVASLVQAWGECQSGRSTVLMEDGLFQVSRARVCVDDVVIVRAGEPVPIDGIVLEGSAFVQQVHPKTLAEPAQVAQGDRVWAGMECATGALALRATAASGDSLVAHAAGLMANISEDDRWASRQINKTLWLYLGILSAFMVAWFAVPEANVTDVAFSAEALVALLLVSIPFGLTHGLTSRIYQAATSFAESGVLPRSLQSVDNLARMKEVALGIEGILTVDAPELEGWVYAASEDEDAIWHGILALTNASEDRGHRLLHSVGQRRVQDPNAGFAIHEPERCGEHGLKGTSDDGAEWALVEGADVASVGAMLKEGAWSALGAGVQGEPALKGKPTMQRVWYLVRDRQVVARYHVFNPLRKEAKDVCHGLQARGWSPFVIGSGSSTRSEEIARMLAVGHRRMTARAAWRGVAHVERRAAAGRSLAGGVSISYGVGLPALADETSELLVLTESMHGLVHMLDEVSRYKNAGRTRARAVMALSVPLCVCAVSGLLTWFAAAALGLATNAILSTRYERTKR